MTCVTETIGISKTLCELYMKMVILHDLTFHSHKCRFHLYKIVDCSYKAHNYQVSITFSSFQIFGLLISIAGFVCAILSVQFGHFMFAHAIIGLVIMVLGVFQPINALL